MIEWGRARGARGRVETWPQGRALPPQQWPSLAQIPRAFAGYIRECAAVDFGPGRLIPWTPVAFGLGVAIYFAADHEPSAIAATLLLAAGLAVAFAARMRPVAFPLAVIAAAAAAGFAVVTLEAAMIAHPVLARPLYGAGITGFVEAREERERSDRFTVRIHKLEGVRTGGVPDRVRVSVEARPGAGGRQFRFVQGAADAAVAAAAAGRLRLRARSLFPAHRRLGFCHRRHQDRNAAGAAWAVAALCDIRRRCARIHRPAHPCGGAGRCRFDCVRA